MKNNPLCDLNPQRKNIDVDELKKELGKYVYLINKFRDGGMDSEFKNVYTDYFDFFHFRGGKRDEKPDEKVLDEYCEGYYTYMEKNRYHKYLSLKDVLAHIVKLQKERNLTPVRVEGVFASKLLSMINPVDRPPWDSVVGSNLEKQGILKALEIKIPKSVGVPENERICAWDTFYTKICELYKDFVNRKTEAREAWMNLFDQIFDEWYEEYICNKKNGEEWLKWLRGKPLSKSKQDMRASITDVKIIDLILWQIRK